MGDVAFVARQVRRGSKDNERARGADPQRASAVFGMFGIAAPGALQLTRPSK